MKKKLRVGIKLGSALLADGKGNINTALLQKICQQAATLIKQGHEVFIVTSGAVASGHKEGRSKNLKSAVGQPRLMNIYSQHFSSFGVEVSQHLFTDRELLAKDSAITKRTLLEAMAEGIIPIINANDSVDSYELKKIRECADNDRLLALVSKLVETDMVIMGLADDGFRDDSGKIIRRVRSSEISKFFDYAKGGNSLGYGKNGMRTKIVMLGELASQGIVAVLSPGKEKDFILRSVAKESGFGTLFVK